MKKILLKFIRLYQAFLSPDHSWLAPLKPYGQCRYYPSCSEYAYRAIEGQGPLQGLWLALWRLLRCNPWSGGGYDPPPSGKLQITSTTYRLVSDGKTNKLQIPMTEITNV